MFIAPRPRVPRSGATIAPSRRAGDGPRVRLRLERLEDRVLLSAGDSIANAVSISFSNNPSTLYQTAHATEYLGSPGAVELNQISLHAGDVVKAAVNTAPYGGGLDSFLRVFQSSGPAVKEIASNDNFQGRDPGLTFQAPTTGTYYVGVSSFDNTSYNPLVAGSGSGSSSGLFDLNLTKTTTAAPLGPLVVASSFHVSQTTAAWGDSLTVSYTVQNRGGLATTGTTAVSLLLSSSNLFAPGTVQTLQAGTVPELDAGGQASGSFTVSLPSSGGPAAVSQVFLGLQIGTAVPSSPEQGNDWAPVQLVTAELAPAGGSNSTRVTAARVDPNSRTTGVMLGAGAEGFYKIVLPQSGSLSASVDGHGAPTSLSLYDAQGIPIVQSDGQSAAHIDPLITQALTDSDPSGQTVYYLKVANLGSTAATYDLTTLFTPSSSTLQTTPVAAADALMVQGDFNGDGRPDLAVVSPNSSELQVLLGNGDGTFQAGASYNLPVVPEALAAGDFTGDGRLDLVVANNGADGVAVLLGNGDGTFQIPPTPLPFSGGSSLAVGDFNGDGNLDLALANPMTGNVSVLLGDGHGSFQAPLSVPLSGKPDALAAGDFNGDGQLDLAVAQRSTGQVTVLLGNGDGTFLTGGSIAVGTAPVAVVAADFTGTGPLDLAVANQGSSNVTVLQGDGHGSFQLAGTYATGSNPTSLVTGDFNGDGHVDLAAADSLANAVTVLLGNGNGTFQAARPAPVGVDPEALVAGDFNGDGRADLATVNYRADTVTVLLGNGDGTFPQVAAPNATGTEPTALITGDFNGDGRLELVTANYYTGDVTVLLGNGDGTFQSAGTFAAGTRPVALVAGDFNGDGRLDLAIADDGNAYSSPAPPPGVTVLLGNGDGTFHPGGFYQLSGKPSALVAGDFNGDGNLDLAVAIKYNADLSLGNSVSFLLGYGTGAFADGGSVSVGAGPGGYGTAPEALVAGDFNGDSSLDLAVANYYSEDVTVLLNQGNSTPPAPGGGSPAGLPPVRFGSINSYGVTGHPVALVSGNFGSDTHPDLAVATDAATDNLTILQNHGDGTFPIDSSYTVSTPIRSLAAGDLNGDGQLDLVAADQVDSSVTVLLADGAGGFTQASTLSVGSLPAAVVLGDFNEDGRLDLATANLQSSDVTVLLGTGTGDFLSPVLGPTPVQSTPLIADLTGTVPDALVLTQTGQILFRRGLADQPGAFAPPVVLNPDPQFAARDLAVVKTSGGLLLAALDANTFADPTNPTGPRLSRVTLYRPHPDGSFTVAGTLDLPAGFLPANIASDDLTGDGLGDLVITAAASNEVFVSLQTSPGAFAPASAESVGVNPSAIALVKLGTDTLPDIVVTDRFSGQVSVLRNEGGGVFQPEERFRAGTGLYGMTDVNGNQAVASLEGTNAVVAGAFGGSTGNDLVVSNAGTGTLSLLAGDGFGGLLNPQAALTFSAGVTATAVVAAHFTGGPNLDLAVLSAEDDSIQIYQGDGKGGFTRFGAPIAAGNQPTGLTVADVTRPGGGPGDNIPDLLVGNAYGDLLILAGNGDGTFSQYQRADRNVSLAVAGAPGTGRHTFYFSNQGQDRLSVATAAAGATRVSHTSVYQDRNNGIRAPGPQTVVSVGGSQYLAVANSGANQLLVYPLLPNGQPDLAHQQTYATGTDPVSITVGSGSTDLNQDGVPDLVVANQGSNDVSVFLGQVQNGVWTLASRPRQSSGGVGPTDVAIADVTGANGTGLADGSPDLLVSNGGSNQVSVLPSRGDGFFINQSPTSVGPGGVVPFQTGTDPQQVFVGHFDNGPGLDLVTVNAVSNDVTLISNFLTAPVTTVVSSGGTFPVAALAGNFTGNGPEELLVANGGNGVLELLQAGPGGFQVAETLVNPDALHLTDLALVDAGNGLEVYGTSAGSETAVLLQTFTVGPQTAPFFVPPSPGFSQDFEISSGGSTGSPSTEQQAVGAGQFFVSAGAAVGNLGTLPGALQQAPAGGPGVGPQGAGNGGAGGASGNGNGDANPQEASQADFVEVGGEGGANDGEVNTARATGQGGAGSGGSGSGILLHNLTDPAEEDTPPPLDSSRRALDRLFELAQQSRGGPGHAQPIAPGANDDVSLDWYWEGFGDEPSAPGTAAAVLVEPHGGSAVPPVGETPSPQEPGRGSPIPMAWLTDAASQPLGPVAGFAAVPPPDAWEAGLAPAARPGYEVFPADEVWQGFLVGDGRADQGRRSSGAAVALLLGVWHGCAWARPEGRNQGGGRVRRPSRAAH